MKVYELSPEALDNHYDGCGRVVAIIGDGVVQGIYYLRTLREWRCSRRHFVRARKADCPGMTVRLGMVSCGQFIADYRH